ncbi:MAG: hypothetical protein WDA74_06180 [Spirochaetota bacterium]
MGLQRTVDSYGCINFEGKNYFTSLWPGMRVEVFKQMPSGFCVKVREQEIKVIEGRPIVSFDEAFPYIDPESRGAYNPERVSRHMEAKKDNCPQVNEDLRKLCDQACSSTEEWKKFKALVVQAWAEEFSTHLENNLKILPEEFLNFLGVKGGFS